MSSQFHRQRFHEVLRAPQIEPQPDGLSIGVEADADCIVIHWGRVSPRCFRV